MSAGSRMKITSKHVTDSGVTHATPVPEPSSLPFDARGLTLIAGAKLRARPALS